MIFNERALEEIYFKFKDIDMELGEVSKLELEKSIGDIIV